jgi:hypothetical protein
MANRIIFVFLLLLSVPLYVSAATLALPKSGVSLCYDDAGTEVNCAGTGQDGELQIGAPWPSPRFTDNNNGTVTDNLTGLTWLKDTHCLDIQPAAGLNWASALVAANGLADSAVPGAPDCGLSDLSTPGTWRLPNVNELESLFDLSMAGPPLPAGHPFLNTSADPPHSPWYWSSTITAVFPTNAEGVQAYTGSVRGDARTELKNVWPVKGTSATVARTGQNTCWAADGTPAADCTGSLGADGDLKAGVAWPVGRFTSSNGTITDNLTGLIWLKKADCFTNMTSQGAALTAANSLASPACSLNDGSLAGDWRLPNRLEMRSLINYEQTDGASYLNGAGVGFTGLVGGWYWTSTSYPTPTANDLKWMIKTEGGTWLSNDVAALAVPEFMLAVRGALKTQRITFTSAPVTFSAGLQINLATLATGGGSGNPVTFNLESGPATLNGATLSVTGAGPIVVHAHQTGNATFYPAADTPHTITVGKGTTTVTLSDLSQVYDGTAKVATASALPAVATITFTYDGSPTAPINGGSYAVVATVNDPDYQGTATGTLVITPAPAVVTLGSLNQVYDGNARAATATAVPSVANVTFTYDGSPTAPVNAGSYTVIGTVVDTNYSGTATGTLTVSQATPTITWGTPATIGIGTALSATQLNATANVAGTFVYTPAAGVVPPVGVQTLSCIYTPNSVNYTTATATTQLTVSPAVTFLVTGSAPGGNGTISCSSPVIEGTSAVCTMTQDPGFHLVSLTDNSTDALPAVSGNSYTISNVTGNHVVTAVFARPDGIMHQDGRAAPQLSDALAVLILATGGHPTPAELARADIAPLGADGRPLGNGTLDIYDVIGVLRMMLGQL